MNGYYISNPQESGVNSNNSGVNSTRRGPWSPEEDKKLMELIGIFGPSNWVRISNGLSSRTPKQCRERYHQNLKPSLNKTPITAEEGELIEKLVEKYGKKWAEISRHLNGRSDNAIKNWWNGGANRRRRTSLASIKSSDEIIKPASHVFQTPAPAQQQPQPSQYPQVQQLPQISFNTSMFGGSIKPDHENNSITSPSQLVLNHSPNIKVPSRSASFDINSNVSLPRAALMTNKRRLLEDHLNNRRHSTANTVYLQNNTMVTNSHPNLSSAAQLNSQSNGSSSPYHGTPLLLSNQNSRKNSISQFEFPPLNSTTNSSRKSSFAPDFFPNPLKDSVSNNSNHKKNVSQNSFNSPSLTPSTMFSVSSASGISANSNISSNTSPITQFELKNSNSSSSTSIHSNMLKERERHERSGSIITNNVASTSYNNDGQSSSQEQPGATKISISSLIN